MMQDLLPDCRDCTDSIWIKLKRDYRQLPMDFISVTVVENNNVF